MLKVGITGAHGLLGWHLRCFLKATTEVSILEATRATFLDQNALELFCKTADVIVHFAGMNRGPDDLVSATNIKLTSDLISACARTNSTPHIIFSSSTHIKRDTKYGESKRSCGELLKNWAHESDGKASILVIPGVFGEGGKPFYNSAVSTFCSQIANGAEPTVEQNPQLELLHAQELSKKILAVIKVGKPPVTQEIELSGHTISVVELLDRIKYFNSMYRDQNLIPELRDSFDIGLFNTFRSYLFPSFYPVDLVRREDARGYLFETVKTYTQGQMFISYTKPGITRGNHFHLTKMERFCVIEGEASIKIRRLFSEDVHEFKVSGSKPQIIDIPTLHTHSITNIGKGELLTLFWTNEIFDPNRPDTYAESV